MWFSTIALGSVVMDFSFFQLSCSFDLFVCKVEIDNISHLIYVTKRPGVDHFLQAAAKNYEVVIFTASLAKVRSIANSSDWNYTYDQKRLLSSNSHPPPLVRRSFNGSTRSTSVLCSSVVSRKMCFLERSIRQRLV